MNSFLTPFQGKAKYKLGLIWDVVYSSWSRLSLFRRFLIFAAFALFTVMAILGWWTTKQITIQLLQTEADASALHMDSVLEPNIQVLAREPTLGIGERQAIDNSIEVMIDGGHIETVIIWFTDGRMAYSSAKMELDRQLMPSTLESALRGETSGRLEDDGHVGPQDVDTNPEKQLIEIYVPLRSVVSGEVLAIGEFYKDAQPLLNKIRTAKIENWLVVGGATGLMMLLLSRIVYRGSETIINQNAELAKGLRRLNDENLNLNEKAIAALTRSVEGHERLLRKLGADLHDGPCQSIAFVLMQLGEVEKALPSGSEAAKQALGEIKIASKEALGMMRAQTGELFLPDYDLSENLNEVLAAIVSNYEMRTRKTVKFTAKPVPSMSTISLRNIARVVQEALLNGYKHAEGVNQSVKIFVEGGDLIVIISNGGTQLPADFHEKIGTDEHLGVVSMKYHIEAIGGKLDFATTPDLITKVVCRVPISQTAR